MAKLCRCGKIVADVCECAMLHKRKKASTTEIGYDGQHKAASERYRKERPLCERCVMTVGVMDALPSKELHHITKISLSPELRMQRRNWLALCRPHHEELEKSELEGMATKRWSDDNYERLLNDQGTQADGDCN